MAKNVWGLVSLSLLPLWYVLLEPMATVNRSSGHGSCEQDFVSEILSLIRVIKNFGSIALCFLS